MRKRKYNVNRDVKAIKDAKELLEKDESLTVNNTTISTIKNILKIKENEEMEKKWIVKRKKRTKKRRVDKRLKWVWTNSILKTKENKEKKKRKEQRKKEENQ